MNFKELQASRTTIENTLADFIKLEKRYTAEERLVFFDQIVNKYWHFTKELFTEIENLDKENSSLKKLNSSIIQKVFAASGRHNYNSNGRLLTDQLKRLQENFR